MAAPARGRPTKSDRSCRYEPEIVGQAVGHPSSASACLKLHFFCFRRFCTRSAFPGEEADYQLAHIVQERPDPVCLNGNVAADLRALDYVDTADSIGVLAQQEDALAILGATMMAIPY